MPRPEQVIPQAPEDAEHGSQAAIERLGTAAPLPTDQQTIPSLEGTKVEPVLPTPAGFEGELNEGYDQALFSRTDRPNEPITHGAPFGAGASFVPMPAEDQYQFLNRVADELQSSPDAAALAPYITEIRRGR